MKNKNFDQQFKVEKKSYLDKLDFIDWTRYFYMFKTIISDEPKSILEFGTGSDIMRSCAEPFVENYTTVDLNEKLKPDIFGDVREFHKDLEFQYDIIIAADILEHIPFNDLQGTIKNFYQYLKPKGKCLITIPHRRSNFLYMTPRQNLSFFHVPTGFLSFGSFYRRFIKRKIWIDDNHCWEIGDGNIKVKDVNECFLKNKFVISNYSKLFYVDYWVLSKSKENNSN